MQNKIFLMTIFFMAYGTQFIWAKEKCAFYQTANLTGHPRYEDGSYLYHDRVIPIENIREYNYHLLFQNEKEEIEPHIRGCVCNSNRYCIKLCCERNEYFNEQNMKCEPLPDSANITLKMEISNDNGNIKKVNVFDHFEYLVGLPCDYPETLSLDIDIWKLMDDGNLYIENDGTKWDTVSYCLTPYQETENDDFSLLPMTCATVVEVTWSLLLNTYAMAFSVIFLVPTVLVYLFLKDLRGNMRGKILICYLISLIVCYSIMSLINIGDIIFEFEMCSALGFTGYYFFISAFLWLSVLCFDIWINFKEHSVEFSARKNFIRFIQYSAYVWGSSALMTMLTIWAQWSDKVPEKYKPGIGIETCWLDTNKWSAAIYFYWPNLIILIFNIATFAHLTRRIYRVRRDLARMTQKERFFQENALVILRLFLIMGISWIMDILSYCLRYCQKCEWLFIATDFVNAIQGVLIFVLFVCKRNVLSAIKKRFNCETARKPRRSVTSFSTQFSKLSTNSTSHANAQ